MRKPLLLIPVLVATALVSAAPSAVSAATSEEIAQSLLDQASQALGVDITDPDLVDELTDGLEYAIEDGSIPQDIVDEIDDAIDSGTDPSDVVDIIEPNILEQIQNWEEYAPEYRENFEVVRAEFQACREASGSARTCAQGLGFKMQVASADDALERLRLLEEQLTAGGVTLTDEERAALEAEIAELRAKIERAGEKLAGLDDSDPAVVEAKGKMARIREEAGRPEEVTQATNQESSGNSTGQGQSGNAGSNGNGAGNGNSGGSGNLGGSGNAGNSGNSGGKGNGKGKP